MRSLRRLIALASTAVVMGCQTAFSAGTAITPVPAAAVAGAGHSAQSVAMNPSAAAAPAAAESGSKRRTVLIVVGVAVLIVAGVLLFGGGSGSSY